MNGFFRGNAEISQSGRKGEIGTAGRAGHQDASVRYVERRVCDRVVALYRDAMRRDDGERVPKQGTVRGTRKQKQKQVAEAAA